jgi:hypothetical protein
VIGAGTAGAAVAGELAARSDQPLLLLEAGPDYGSFEDGRWPADLTEAPRESIPIGGGDLGHLTRPYYLHGKVIFSKHAYLLEQEKRTEDRDHDMLSDQDVLSALLASLEFRDIAVHLLHGSEILQHHGAGAYGLRQKWQNLGEWAATVVARYGNCETMASTPRSGPEPPS